VWSKRHSKEGGRRHIRHRPSLYRCVARVVQRDGVDGAVWGLAFNQIHSPVSWRDASRRAQRPGHRRVAASSPSERQPKQGHSFGVCCRVPEDADDQLARNERWRIGEHSCWQNHGPNGLPGRAQNVEIGRARLFPRWPSPQPQVVCFVMCNPMISGTTSESKRVLAASDIPLTRSSGTGMESSLAPKARALSQAADSGTLRRPRKAHGAQWSPDAVQDTTS
jgi:hypothetical protein